jgi:hypothetical protein
VQTSHRSPLFHDHRNCENYQVKTSDITEISKATQWKPGQSGNVNGRPVDFSPSLFSQAFLKDLAEGIEDWQVMREIVAEAFGEPPVNWSQQFAR